MVNLFVLAGMGSQDSERKGRRENAVMSRLGKNPRSRLYEQQKKGDFTAVFHNLLLFKALWAFRLDMTYDMRESRKMQEKCHTRKFFSSEFLVFRN